MGWLAFLICTVPIYLLFNAGHPVLWALAPINAAANLWSYGVMHNYAVESSANKIKRLRENLALEGRLNAEKQMEIDKLKLKVNLKAVPSWLTYIDIVTFIIGLGLLAFGIWILL